MAFDAWSHVLSRVIENLVASDPTPFFKIASGLISTLFYSILFSSCFIPSLFSPSHPSTTLPLSFTFGLSLLLLSNPVQYTTPKSSCTHDGRLIRNMSSPPPRSSSNNSNNRGNHRERIIYQIQNAEDAARMSLLHGREVVTRKATSLWTHFKVRFLKLEACHPSSGITVAELNLIVSVYSQRFSSFFDRTLLTMEMSWD